MARTTPAQDAILKALDGFDNAWRMKKRDAKMEARIIVERAISATLAQRDMYVRIAIEAGIPKSQIGERGLHTTSPSAIVESLARTADNAVQIATSVVPRFEWVTTEEKQPYLNGGVGMGTVEKLHVTMSGPDWDQFVADCLRDKTVHPKRVAAWGDKTEHTFLIDEAGTVGYLCTPDPPHSEALFSFLELEAGDELADWLEANPHTVYEGNFYEPSEEEARLMGAEPTAPKERKAMNFSKVLEDGK